MKTSINGIEVTLSRWELEEALIAIKQALESDRPYNFDVLTDIDIKLRKALLNLVDK